MQEPIASQQMPVLALRGIVVYPAQTVHFDIAREKSVKALEKAMEQDQTLILVPQKDIQDDDPSPEDLYVMGTVVKIKQMLRTTGETIRVLVTGLYRAQLCQIDQTDPYLLARVMQVEDKPYTLTTKTRATIREANLAFQAYMEMQQHSAQGLQLRMMASTDPGFIADCLAQYSSFDYPEKADLLLQLNPTTRLDTALRLLAREIEMLTIELEMQSKARASMDQGQRDYYLREQLKAIRSELGEDDETNECEKYRAQIIGLQFPKETEEKLLKDVDRLAKQPFGSSEGAVLRNYLDTVLDLPWNIRTKERLDIQAALKVLDRDHFGMEKVKERILETLAVRQMAPEMPPQVLCLVGPPGVGKTSIAYSIAKSLKRNMVRISLGGVRDEADIRGHRKTYVGAMPGRIVTAMGQAKSMNPLILLDEIDKMGSDYRGDPSAALLEVLDGEQNHTYRDHYLEIPMDLSDVLFICTANTLDTIPRPLLDRMEVIELGSYTDEEKKQIAKDHLIPKQLKKHGLKKSQLRITDDALAAMIRGYTRESGVRNLERMAAQICRKADLLLVGEDAPKKVTVSDQNLEEFLGVRRYLPEDRETMDTVGLVTGLAWTSVGGEVLQVEVNVMEGSGKLELTGNLGDVMKESARAAVSYIRSHAKELGVPMDFYKTKDIHVHFPEGAVPKDGPSAGVTVCTAIVSALTGRTARRDVAMTGEISIRGRVLPIGGLKEKTMAALRHGIKTVVIPQANARDLEEIDPCVRSQLHFVTAVTADTVLETALNPIEDTQELLCRIPPESMLERKPQIQQ